jgi:hypothetical protein
MKHTVIGVFDTYSQARQAEHALVEAGFQRPDIAIHAIRGTAEGTAVRHDWRALEGARAGYPGAGLDASTGAFSTEPLEADLTTPTSRNAETASFGASRDESAWARVEHFFAGLFGLRLHPPEAAHYREALRRGSALVSVDVFADAQVGVARETMLRAGAIDLERRVEQWREGGYRDDALASVAPDEPDSFSAPPDIGAVPEDRAHSPVDELGLADPLSAYYRQDPHEPAADARNARAVRSYARGSGDDGGWRRFKETVRHGWNRLTGHR